MLVNGQMVLGGQPAQDFARLLVSGGVAHGAGADVPDPLRDRIQDAIDLCNNGSARVSRELLQKFRRDEWSASSPRNRCRIVAGIGFTHFALGEDADAVASFRMAYAEDPDRPGARTLLALAHHVSGDDEAAFDVARQALAEDPGSEQAAAIVAAAAPVELRFSEVEALIPGPLRGRPEILVSLANAARTRSDEQTHLRLAEEAHARAPNDWRTCAALSEALLSPILAAEAIALTRQVPSVLIEQFRRGHELLRQAWSKVESGDNARRASHIAANYAAILTVTGNDEGAERVVEKGLEHCPDDPALLRRRAVHCALRGDWPAVRAAMSSIAKGARDPEDLVLAGKAALACGDIRAAQDAADAALEQAAAGSRALQTAAALKLETELAGHSGAAGILAAWDAHPDSIIIRSAALEEAKADPALKARLLADAARIGATSRDERDRTLAADALGALGEYGQSADLFSTVAVPLDQDTYVLRGRLRALVLADRRKEARTLFEGIAPPLRGLRPYFELGVTIYDRAGMLPRALRLVEEQLGREPADLQARLVWIDLCDRAGRGHAAQDWLAGVSGELPGSPQALMSLALVLDRQLADPKALRLGYWALRLGYDDPRIHTSYTFGLFIMGRAAKAGLACPLRAAPDTAVSLRQVNGDGAFTRIIETEPDPRLERDEIPPDHALAARLTGLAVGDELDLPAAGSEPRRFRVEQVQDKYLFAHFRSLSDFHRLFPDSQAFSTFSIGTGDGDDGVEPLLQEVRRRGEYITDLQDRYRGGTATLGFAAVAAGCSVFDLWDGFAAHPDMPIFCSAGTQAEADQAFERLQTAELCILDPLMPYAVVQLGIHSLVHASLPRLGVTQSTLDLLRKLAEDRRGDRQGRRGTMFWANGRYVMHEMSTEEVETRISVAEQALRFAEGCSLVPAEASRPIPAEALPIYGLLPAAFLDATIAAQEPGRVLLCDDLAARAVAEACGTHTVWTQVMLQHGVQRRVVASADYADAVAKLVGAGYTYVRLGTDEILHAFRHNDWRADGGPTALLGRLALPGNEPFSVTRVASELLIRGWMETQGDGRFGNLARTLVRQLQASQPEMARSATQSILLEVYRMLRLRAWALNRKVWLRTTSLVSPEYAERAVLRPARRALERIASAMETELVLPPAGSREF